MLPVRIKFKLDATGRVTKKRVEVLAADAREEGDGKALALAKSDCRTSRPLLRRRVPPRRA